MESRGASTDAFACLENIRAATGCFVSKAARSGEGILCWRQFCRQPFRGENL